MRGGVFLVFDVYKLNPKTREWELHISAEAILQAELVEDNLIWQGYHTKVISRATGRQVKYRHEC